MTETRLDRALFAARLRGGPGKDKTLLTTETQDDVCAELLQLHEDVRKLEAQAAELADVIAELKGERRDRLERLRR